MEEREGKGRKRKERKGKEKGKNYMFEYGLTYVCKESGKKPCQILNRGFGGAWNKELSLLALYLFIMFSMVHVSVLLYTKARSSS